MKYNLAKTILKLNLKLWYNEVKSITKRYMYQSLVIKEPKNGKYAIEITKWQNLFHCLQKHYASNILLSTGKMYMYHFRFYMSNISKNIYINTDILLNNSVMKSDIPLQGNTCFNTGVFMW